jgi:polysaccharide export outer membrane protein
VPLAIRRSRRLRSLALALAALVSVALATEDRYRLGTGDHVRIEVYGEEILADSLIGDSGALTLPYVGDVGVSGSTAGEVRSRLTDLLVPDYFVDPDIIVSVEKYRSFFVYGEVRSPGGYAFEPGLTVGKAIALAGGLTDRASTRRIFVMPDGADEDSEIRADESTSIGPGDVITIRQSFF